MGLRTASRLAATLLVVEALLVVSPVLAVSNLFVGAGLVGKSIAFVRVADLGVQAAAYLLGPLLVLLLLLAAWGVWRGTSGVGALVLQLPVAAAGLVPFLRPLSPLSVVPYGTWLLPVVAVITAALLLWRWRLLRAPSARARRSWRRLWWVAGFAVVVAALAVAGSTDRSLPFDPASRLLTQFDGAPADPSRAPADGAPPQNPGLADNPWNSIHNDSWATDSYRLPAPSRPDTAAVESVFTGGDCATITFDSRGRLVTLCSTLTRVIAYVIDPATLDVLAQQVVSSRAPDPTDFTGGGYFFLDDTDRIVMPTSDGSVLVLSTGGEQPRIAQQERHDVSATLQSDERLIAVMPDWERHWWYAGDRGTVGVLDPRSGRTQAQNLGGERIGNSFAVAEDGVYVVTEAALYRVRAAESGPPQVVWRTPYDAGTTVKAGQANRGSGTTPTVFAAGRLVAITDNAEPRMNLLVARTADGVVRCTVPLFADERSATENSIIAAGSTLVVENNEGYAPPVSATSGGHTTSPGLVGVTVSPNGQCRQRWHNGTLSIPSAVSKATLAGNLVLTYAKDANPFGADGWRFTAVDLTDGRVLWQRLAGAGAAFNNHYAAVTLGPKGDLFVGTTQGIAVLRNR